MNDYHHHVSGFFARRAEAALKTLLARGLRRLQVKPLAAALTNEIRAD